ncbi:MAG TPA: hypothetical protein PK406_00645 [Verrucomicrobiota bacterium]|nr:hypothetical protein [Verrucomicrobiota bacterium]
MATATHGKWTAEIKLATTSQVNEWDRYQANRETLRALMADLGTAMNQGAISAAEYADKMACLVDLCQQAEQVWIEARPVVEWS